MKVLWVVFVFLVGIFLSGTNLVLAEENHNNDSHHEESSNESHNDSGQQENVESHDSEMDHSHGSSKITSSPMTEEEHQESLKHEESNHQSGTHEESNSHSGEHDQETSQGGKVDFDVDALQEGHEHEEEGGHSHGGGDIVEKPGNVMVLGTFGAINLSFILIGIWNKWFRRREEA